MSSYLIFTNQKTKKRLVFYPVPKNANTSTKLFFAKHLGIDKDYVFLSDDKPEYQFRDNMYEILKDKKNLLNFFPLKQKFSTVDAEEKCCIIRDPIKRFLSAYKNRILYHQDLEFKNHSIDMIIEKLESSNFENQHFLPQNYFLGNDLNYFTILGDTNNMKNFVNGVNNFFEKNVEFPQLQTGGNKEVVNLSNLQITKIKQIYKDDYLLLDKYL
tara:strand:+ start:127 stop:768 length:642 start_codon:yes stop_codon:yes gene_type:complete